MDIAVQSPEIVSIPVEAETVTIKEPAPAVEEPAPPVQKATPLPETGTRVSAFSLASIKARKELEQAQQKVKGTDVKLPTEPFTETDLMLQWNKYAQRLSDKGHKIMESLMLISDPKVEGTKIIHELPNDGARIDFESEKLDLMGYLRGKLHNHDLSIELVVNEKMDNRKAFTPQDKYNRLNEINPALELLRKSFDLEL